MLHRYGHGTISIGNEVYTLLPSFANIARLGNPKEIIEKIKSLNSESSLNWRFMQSLEILNCCLDKPLPESVTGSLVHNGKKLLYKPSKLGRAIFNDVFVLAAHCIKHGVTGEQIDIPDDAEPMSEFDPYEFIEMAQIHFNVSIAEASNMTMTQFVRRVKAQTPKSEEDKNPNVKIVDGVRYERFQV